MDAGLGGGLARRVVEALGGGQLRDRRAAARDGEQADLLLVVGALAGRDAAEGELVAGDLDARRRRFMVTTRSLCQAVVATMPSTIRPMPAWASVVP